MTERYVIRPDAHGYSVIDMWTGAPIDIAMAPQTGMTGTDAAHIAELLNQRAEAALNTAPAH